MKNQLSTSENLYLFAGWLTMRAEKTVLSGSDDASAMAMLTHQFIETQGLEKPREEWNNLDCVNMGNHDIVTRKGLDLLTKEDAEAALFACTGGKPSGYKYIRHDHETIVFNYTNRKSRIEAKRFKFEQLGFKAFNLLQSKGYILK